MERVIPRVKAIKQGNPLDTETMIGAQASDLQMTKIQEYLQLGVEEGAQVLTGGTKAELGGDISGGYYINPTLFKGHNKMRIFQEEIFGPVVTIQAFDSDEEAIALANGTNYGLACSIWTQDVSRAHRLARDIDAGLVWVNTWMLRDLRVPMGGMKHSGVGREGGFEAMRFFTEPKTVTIRYEQP